MTELAVGSPSRPRRAAAQNALYKPCPTCDKKFLITELEFHVNLCLQKLERTPAASSTSSSGKTPRGACNYVADPKYQKIPAAPEFRPTVEEFKNPLEYISSIRPLAQKHGICKIIPPTPAEEWLGTTFEKNVEQENFLFQTKCQNVRELARRGVNDSFYVKLTHFMEKRGKHLKAVPRLAGRRIQLYQLFRIVEQLGGSANVTKKQMWGAVASELKLPPIPETVLALRRIFKDNLFLYESSSERFDMSPSPTKRKGGSFGMRAQRQQMGMRAVKAPELTASGERAVKNEEDDDKDEPYGFATGKMYSLLGFKKQAKRFARRWFELSGVPTLTATPEQVETEFWNIVEEQTNDCCVQYGSDLDVKSHGSGFSLESTNPWNLNIMPTLAKSLLRFLPEHVSGITIPMMYVGMVFSCFCWHVEDDYLYSINFLHTGAPKTWYGVSSLYCSQFERVMKDALPDLFEVQPDLLHHLTTMLSPLELMENGVPVVRTVQHPGEFVVTFPQAYHGGFNTGFNVAEAVNFAIPDWLPFSKICVTNYKLVKRTHIFSNTELVVNALQLEKSPDTIKWLMDYFWTAREEEIGGRRRVEEQGIVKVTNWSFDGPLPHSKSCRVCNQECYLSAVSCGCAPDLHACLEHGQEFCKCSNEEKYLLVRYSPALLDAVVAHAEKVLSSVGDKRHRSPVAPSSP